MKNPLHADLKTVLILILALSIHKSDLFSQEAQWRGPNRDGIYPDTALLKEWPVEGPEIVFATSGLGRAYSSAVANGDIIYTTGTVEKEEYLTALDLKGNILWQKSYGPAWNQSIPEARCTPTVDGERIYVHTGLDKLSCLDSKTGDQIWSVDLHETYKSSWDMFGVSESPLIVDNMVVTTPAGEETTAIALDKMTGELIWKSKSLNTNRSNMSPLAIEHFGKKYVITATQTHLHGVDLENGEILWSYHYNFLTDNKDNTTILANTPIYRDSCLWVSHGWDVKSVRLEIAPDGRSVSERYADHTFDNQNHGVVLVDKYLYGSNFTGRNSGKWVCMNWHTGEIVWLEEWHNKGPVIYADGLLYLIEEKHGNVALVKADPKEFGIISTFQVKEGKGPFWARPSIYNGMLLVRHGDYLIAYDIKQKGLT